MYVVGAGLRPALFYFHALELMQRHRREGFPESAGVSRKKRTDLRHAMHGSGSLRSV